MLLATNTNETTGTLVFDETVKMQIDPSASGIILDSLIRIYSNPYVAALREYTSNAWDSHMEAGQTKAIEVSLPSALAPVLVVEDFGMGMSRAQLAQYGQFGFSTKRNDNDNIGGFGLGSKVGLAFSSQYSVQAVKDGKKNVAIIGRDEDGNPQMGLLEEVDTDLPNGVKVMIPTNEYHKFNEALSENFFIGFAPEAIKIDGRFPKISVHNPEQFMPLEDGLGWRRAKGSTHKAGAVAVVHGVRYLINWHEVQGDIDYTLRTGFLSEVVLNLENGAVEIQRSREALVYSKRTREVLSQKFTALMEYATEQYKADIEKAETIREALRMRESAISFGFKADYTWRGQVISTAHIPKHNHNEDPFTAVTLRSGGNSSLGLIADKHLTNYGQIVRTWNKSLWGMKSILVVGASAPSETRGKVSHSESFGASQWANHMEEQGQGRAEEFNIFFTSGSVKHYSKWFIGAFEQIITADEFMAIVTAIRKENATAAAVVRKANALLNASSDLMVRQLNYRDEGHSTWHEAKVAELDPEKTHVVLQAGQDDFTDRLRRVLLTRSGYYEHTYLAGIVKFLIDNANVVFLLANKSTKMKQYDGVLPNAVLGADLPAFVAGLSKKLVAKKSDIQKRAILDRAAGDVGWAMRFPVVGIKSIKLPLTRQWIEALHTRSTIEDTFLGTVSGNAERLGIDAGVATITSTVESPNDYYPLMQHLSGWAADYEEVVEYMTMKDTAAGRI